MQPEVSMVFDLSQRIVISTLSGTAACGDVKDALSDAIDASRIHGARGMVLDVRRCEVHVEVADYEEIAAHTRTYLGLASGLLVAVVCKDIQWRHLYVRQTRMDVMVCLTMCEAVAWMGSPYEPDSREARLAELHRITCLLSDAHLDFLLAGLSEAVASLRLSV